MATQIAGIVLLAAMFIVATTLPINMGALALVASFIIDLLPAHTVLTKMACTGKMLICSAAVVAVGPLLTWLVLIVPRWL